MLAYSPRPRQGALTASPRGTDPGFRCAHPGHKNTTEDKMNRRAAILAVIVSLMPSAAFAQSFPAKPIKLIVPFPAGGPADLFARVLGNGMTAELGQQIVIENRAGVGGMAGVDALAKSTPDG